MYGALFLSLTLFYFVNKFSKRIKKHVSENRKETIPFGISIVSGMISGVIVIVLDRIINQFVKNPVHLDTSSIYNMLLSITGIVIIALLTTSILLWTIFYLIQKGVVGLSNMK